MAETGIDVGGLALVSVDGGPAHSGRFGMNTEILLLESQHDATRPDPSWEHADTAGHFHAYDARDGSSLPTLTERRFPIECDGTCGVFACEGTTVTIWQCLICDEPVLPARLPAPGPKPAVGARSWWAQIDSTEPIPQGPVSAVIIPHDFEHPMSPVRYFGVADASTTATYSDDTTMRYTTRLYGIGEIGQRNTLTPAPAAVAS